MYSALALLLQLLVSTVAFWPPTQKAPLRLAVPPFVTQPIGMEDEILPTAAQLAALRALFIHALNSTSNFRAAPIAPTCNPDSSDNCRSSRAAARHAGATVVIQGYVTRHMAIMWDVDFVMLNAATGRSNGPWDNEIKGDFDAVLFGMPGLAADAAKHAASLEGRT